MSDGYGVRSLRNGDIAIWGGGLIWMGLWKGRGIEGWWWGGNRVERALMGFLLWGMRNCLGGKNGRKKRAFD